MGMNFTKLFFDIDPKLNVIKCENIPSFHMMSLQDFYDKYISKQLLEINDADYSYSHLVEMILANESSNIYLFPSSRENQFYQFELVRNNDGSFSCFIVFLSNVKNYDNYGKIDYLTNIDSRATFIKKVINDFEDEAFENAALLMIDLDDFKNINDNFGHIVGDNCLKQVSSCLCNIDGIDYVGRYGGDEFIAFIKEPQKKDFNAIIEKILTIRLASSDKFEGRINLNLSIGICNINIHEKKDLKTYIQYADSALYDSKQHGKNTYSIYGQQNRYKKKIKNQYSGKNFTLFIDAIKRKNRIKNFLLVFTIAMLISMALISSFHYSSRIERIIDTETQQTMKDVSSQISLTIEKEFTSWFGELNMAAEAIDYSNLDESLKKIEGKVNFEMVALLYEDGNLYFNEELGTYDMAVDGVSKALIIDNKPYIGKTNLNYNGEYIVFGIPFGQTKTVSNSDFAGIVGLTRTETFNDSFNSSLFDDNLAIAVLDRDGTKICANAKIDTPFLKYNNLTNIYDENESSEVSNDFRYKLNNGETFTSSINVDNVTYYAYTTAVDSQILGDKVIDSWRIMLIVPSHVLNKRLRSLMETVVAVYVVVFLILSSIIIILSISHSKNVSKSEHLMYIDPLTNNINEKRFIIDSKRVLQIYKESKYAVICFNIMHFKFINDTYGLELGNDIICELYHLIISKLSNHELVARIIADRFVCLKEYHSEEDLNEFIESINDEMSHKKFANCFFQIHLIAGVYKIINQTNDINVAIDKANMALEGISDEYMTSYINYFDDEMLIKNNEMISLEQNQERALQNQEFIVYYQAKRDIKDDKFSGSEALVRWKDADKGMISPGKFIPLFERNGFVIKLDLYVFERVCIDIRNMLDNGQKPLRVSINMSGKHIFVENFFDRYIEIINKYNIPSEYLEFELTENVFLENIGRLAEIISKIHSIGCICSIDDFGSGYSSLNMFKDFDFDVIKLDRKFFYGVRGLNDSTKTIIASIVKLSHQLNKKVVAEGIETEEQIKFLKEIGCDYVQGFFYSEPVSLASYIELINK